MIAAPNGHLLALDNLSGLPGWISDALYRLATGGSFAVRQLYTDAEEVLFEAACPILLNGIEDVVNRPDPGDRTIFVTLPHIPENRAARAVRTTARHGVWATACQRALWPAGTFARAYAGNRRAAIDDLIEADPVADRVRELMAERTTWKESAAELLITAKPAPGAPHSNRFGDWPRTPRALAGRLRRAQTFLRTVGIQMVFSREARSSFGKHPQYGQQDQRFVVRARFRRTLLDPIGRQQCRCADLYTNKRHPLRLRIDDESSRGERNPIRHAAILLMQPLQPALAYKPARQG